MAAEGYQCVCGIQGVKSVLLLLCLSLSLCVSLSWACRVGALCCLCHELSFDACVAWQHVGNRSQLFPAGRPTRLAIGRANGPMHASPLSARPAGCFNGCPSARPHAKEFIASAVVILRTAPGHGAHQERHEASPVRLRISPRPSSGWLSRISLLRTQSSSTLCARPHIAVHRPDKPTLHPPARRDRGPPMP
ncbi:hypothetical protein BKA66DRAFT_235996 [Pyrenochaeta sp. MPI-SDFR-AT-0127]|nr:hypothetical protein BKA66DRAFT_235996 [Pyrenochaeta sp. MPI-SDFR-AT-0127]